MKRGESVRTLTENSTFLTFKKFSGVIRYGTRIAVYVDFKERTKVVWSGTWTKDIKRKAMFGDDLLNAEVTNVSINGEYLYIGICYQ